jgi:hypothetical protein
VHEDVEHRCATVATGARIDLISAFSTVSSEVLLVAQLACKVGDPELACRFERK